MITSKHFLNSVFVFSSFAMSCSREASFKAEGQQPSVQTPISSVLKITSSPKTTHDLGNALEPSTPFDLSLFKSHDFSDTALWPPTHPVASWTVSSASQSVLQSLNARPSIFYQPVDLDDYQISGKWQTSSVGDDDYMGFVFALQDPRKFYIFAWKRADQSVYTGDAKKGMKVLRVSADSPVMMEELWSLQDSPGRMKVLFSNDVIWEANKEYIFNLTFHPGEFMIQIKDQSTELANIKISDNTYRKGAFGFYNFSQPEISYSGFSATRLPPRSYEYQAQVSYNGKGDIKYRLFEAPAGMSVDPSTGMIRWEATRSNAGTYPVSLEASDGLGAADIQSFRLTIQTR